MIVLYHGIGHWVEHLHIAPLLGHLGIAPLLGPLGIAPLLGHLGIAPLLGHLGIAPLLGHLGIAPLLGHLSWGNCVTIVFAQEKLTWNHLKTHSSHSSTHPVNE